MSSLSGYTPISSKSLNGIIDIVADSATIDDLTISSVSVDTLTVSSSADFTCSPNLSLGHTYKINDTDVLSDTYLGSGVVSSSLTSTGILSSLTVGGNINQTSGSASLQALTVPSISCSGNISGTLTTISQPNVTSLGNLTGLIVSGNVSQTSGSASLQALTVPSISCSGNISGTLTTISQPNVTSLGNLTSLTVAGNISQTSGNASLQSLTVPSISCSGNISGTITTASQTNITSVGNLSGLVVAGNISQTSGSASLQSLTVPSVTCSGNISGTLTTSSQPYITTLGNLTSLSVTGNIVTANVAKCKTLVVDTGATTLSATGNVAGTFTGSIAILNGTNDNRRFISALDNNMPNSTDSYITWGTTNSSYNQAELKFHYNSSNSTSNALALGLYGKELMTLYGDTKISTAGSIYSQFVGFRALKSGSWTVSNTTYSLLRGVTISGTDNRRQYDSNPTSSNGWDSTNGYYKVPWTGYYQFSITLRSNDDGTTYGFQPVYLVSSIVSNLFLTSDNQFWVSTDDAGRRCTSYTTQCYLNAGEAFYARPYNTTITWQYVEYTGHFLGY